MVIPFGLEDVFRAGSHPADDALVLRALLDALVAADRVYLRRHPADHAALSLYRSGVVYGRTDTWDSIPDVRRRGYGDCKSLTAWRVAELLEGGVAAEPVFRFLTRSDGGKDFHILVKTSTGFEDPSKKLGMGTDENRWFRKAS